MIGSFKGKATEDIFNGVNSKLARKACPQTLWRIAARKLDQLDSVQSLDELKVPPGNRLESLSDVRTGSYSIRINEQYRICFTWEESGRTWRNPSFLINQLVNTLIGNMNCPCKFTLGDIHGNKEFFPKHFAGMGGFSIGWNSHHILPSVIISYFHIRLADIA